MILAKTVLKNPAFLLLTALFFIFLTASSFASPKVGDYLQFMMTNVDSFGKETRVRMESEIISVDATGSVFTVKETQTPIAPTMGQPEIEKNNVSADEFLTLAQIEQQLKYCTSRGGKTEPLRTPAGDFQSCRMTVLADGATQSLWYARVPQGVVKSQLRDEESGFFTQLELVKYRFGR